MHPETKVQVGILLAYRITGLNAFSRYLTALSVLHEFRSGAFIGYEILDFSAVASRLPAFYHGTHGSEVSDQAQGLRMSYHWVGMYILFNYGFNSQNYRYYLRSINLLNGTDAQFVVGLVDDIFNR